MNFEIGWDSSLILFLQHMKNTDTHITQESFIIEKT